MATPKQSSLGTRQQMNFLTYHGIFWNLRPLKNTTSKKFWWEVGVAVDLVQIWNMWGKEQNAAKNSRYFPACSAVLMLKIEARSVSTRTRGCSSASATKESKQITCKLGLGLNFAVNVDFWVCNDDFDKKKTEGKNVIFVVFLCCKKRSFLFLSKFKRWYSAKIADIFVFIGYLSLKDWFLVNGHNWLLRRCLRNWESCKLTTVE